MRNQRDELSRPWFAGLKEQKKFDWEFVFKCFDMEEREFQYLALSYLAKKWMLIEEKEFDNIEKLAFIKPWWDTIDSVSPCIGHLVKKYPALLEKYIYKWMKSEDKWLIRWSILFQLKYKTDTNTKVLADAIISNCDTNEFFINKAIGWALREYAKTDPEWVKQFLKENTLSNLSIKEAGKHLK
jgi:3-methyladenine DNA glycosylase AlkD